MQDKDIIKLLKDNRYPFGMWPEPECYGPELGKEMQEKARELCRSGDLQEYSCNERWEKHSKDYVLRNNIAYRLRDTYQEQEPEIEKLIVRDRGNGLLEVWGDGMDGTCKGLLHEMPSRPDIIGFLYEDGIVRAYHRCYKSPGGNVFYEILEKDISIHEVLTPTAVLFSKKT